MRYFERINQHDDRFPGAFCPAVRQPSQAPEVEGLATQDHRPLRPCHSPTGWYRIDDLSEAQLTEYFSELIDTHSWSAVKLDLYGLKFFTTHVLKKPWAMPNLIKPPKTQRLPDIVTVDEAQRLFSATRVLSYRVFYFTLYSLGLRLGEGLALKVGDIDADRMRVQVRDAKGNRDRFVPLSPATLRVLRRFWQTHRHPELLFPNRHAGLKGAHLATSPLDRGGVQITLRKVAAECGLKKRSPRTACGTATPRI